MFRENAETLSAIIGEASSQGRAPDADLFSSTLSHSIRRHETQRLSMGDGLHLPHIIVPADYDTEDFFVSLATFYPNYAPLTAFVYVLDRETRTYFRQEHERGPRSSYRDSNDWQLASIGAAIGETYLLAISTTDVGTFPGYSACKRSLAYAICRAKSIYPFCDFYYVAKRWARLRRLTGLGVTDSSMTAVQLSHALLFDQSNTEQLAHFPPTLLEAIRSYLREVRTNQFQLTTVILEMYPRLELYMDGLSGPFDARMKAFTELAAIVRSATQGRDADSVAVAFLCNLILPGSFDHARVLAKLVEWYPTALIWYGIFSAVTGGMTQNTANYGLVSKLIRDANCNFSFENRPECDLSLDELEVLSRLSLKPEAIRPSHQKVASIALLPGVDVFSRISAESESTEDRDRDRRIVESRELNLHVTKMLEEAILVLRRNRAFDPLRASSRIRHTRKDGDK
jgi:hypothetical protein